MEEIQQNTRRNPAQKPRGKRTTKEDHPRTRQNDVMPPAVKIGQQPVKNPRRDDAPAGHRPAGPPNPGHRRNTGIVGLLTQSGPSWIVRSPARFGLWQTWDPVSRGTPQIRTKDAPQGNAVASWPGSTGRTRHAEDWNGTPGEGHKDTYREG